MPKAENVHINRVHRFIDKQRLFVLKTNMPYTAGIPDCYYSGPKGCMWIEYKREGNTPTEAQWVFLVLRASEGRDVGIAFFLTDGSIGYITGVDIIPAIGVPIAQVRFTERFKNAQAFAAFIKRKVGEADSHERQQLAAMVISRTTAKTPKSKTV